MPVESVCLQNPGCPYGSVEEFAKIVENKTGIKVVLGTHGYHWPPLPTSIVSLSRVQGLPRIVNERGSGRLPVTTEAARTKKDGKVKGTGLTVRADLQFSVDKTFRGRK